MKRATTLSFVIALLLNAPLITKAQTAPTRLSDVTKALDCLDRNGSMSAWKRERVEPFTGGADDIFIYDYISGGWKVMVKVMYYPSDAEANLSFNSFETHASGVNFERLQNLGDEAYSWGFDDSVVMRKRNLTVYVTAVTNTGSLLPEVAQAEVSALASTERKLLAKNFARMMDKTLSSLSEACRSELIFRY
jgi:hypothetical protein